MEAVKGSGARTTRVTPSKINTGVVASVNLRDCGLYAANLKEGILLRSSQVLRYAVGQTVYAYLGLFRVTTQFPGMQCFRDQRASNQGQSIKPTVASCYALLQELQSRASLTLLLDAVCP